MKRKQFFWEQLQNTDELLNKDNLKEEKKKEKSPEEIIDEILKEEEEEKEKEEKNSTSSDKTNKDDNKTDKNKLTETEKWISKQKKKQKDENKQGQQKDENKQKSERENEEATFNQNNQNNQKNVRANQENGKVSKEKIIKRKEGEKGEEEKLKGKDERKKDLEEDNDNLQNKNKSDVDYNSNVSKTFESNKEKDLKNAEKKEENFKDNVDNQKEVAEEKNQNESKSNKEEKKEKEKAKTKDKSEKDLEVGKNKNVENDERVNEEVNDEREVNGKKGIDDEDEEYDESNKVNDKKEINNEDKDYDENDEVNYIKDETFYSYKFNFQKAFEVKEDRNKKRERSYVELRKKFEQLLWLLGERESIYPCKGNDYFDVDLYLTERHNRFKNLYNFFYSHKKDKIVVIVDTSGSCYPFADLITKISQVALSFDLVEVYEAPNGVITSRLFLHKKQLKTNEIYPPISNWSNFLGNNRKIIFVGDFDGGDSVIEASFTNKVIWFSVEDRYDDTLQHSWCSYSLKNFNGIYKKNLTIEDFIKNIEEIKREYAKYEIKFKLDNFYNQFKQVDYFHFKKRNKQF